MVCFFQFPKQNFRVDLLCVNNIKFILTLALAVRGCSTPVSLCLLFLLNATLKEEEPRQANRSGFANLKKLMFLHDFGTMLFFYLALRIWCSDRAKLKVHQIKI